MKVSVILPAAGKSSRFNSDGGSKSKVEIELAGKPIFLHALDPFLNHPDVSGIVIAVSPDALDQFKFRHGDKLAFHGIKIVAGGTIDRWETVRNALAVIDENATHVAVHDAARPLVTRKLVDRVFEGAAQFPAVIPGKPVSATLKKVEPLSEDESPTDPLDAILGGAGKSQQTFSRVTQTVDRTSLVEVQTPQVFERQLLCDAYEQIASGKISHEGITDDAALVEHMGTDVIVVDGEATNLKVTVQEDIELAAAIAASRKEATSADFARKRLFGDDDDE